MNRILLFCFVLSVFSTASVQAQKIAYINSNVLMMDVPEIKQADTQLQTFQTQLQKKGEKMVTDLQAKYQEIAKKEQAGEIAPKQLEEEGRKLKEEEAKITQFEQDMNRQIAEKRQLLYQPILDKVNALIAEVAKEKGYTSVFDSSTGVLLYADPAYDITNEVKARLPKALAGTTAQTPATTNPGGK